MKPFAVEEVFGKTGDLRTKIIEKCCIIFAVPVEGAQRILPFFCKFLTSHVIKWFYMLTFTINIPQSC